MCIVSVFLFLFLFLFLFFFFQAEDGIRDHCVTGVQTCALPILAVVIQSDNTHIIGQIIENSDSKIVLLVKGKEQKEFKKSHLRFCKVLDRKSVV